MIGPGQNGELLWINQDAWFSLAILDKGFESTYAVKTSGHGTYVFVIEGNVTVDGHSLKARDGVGLWETDAIHIKADSDAQVLVIEVPMSDNE